MPSSKDDAHLARRSVLFQIFRATCLSACLVDFLMSWCYISILISDDRDREQWSAFEGQLISKNFSKCPKDISTLLRLDTWLDGCANRSILFTTLTRNVVLVQLFLPGSRPGGNLWCPIQYWCYMHTPVPKESCVDRMILCILHFLVCTCMYILVNSGSHLKMDGRRPTK